jgi:MYXO-CTERM domain-containing protein
MRLSSKSWLVLLSAGIVTAATSFACSSAPPTDDEEGATAAATAAPFDRNAVLDDVSMKDSDAMSEADIQKMLDRNPWGKKSVLATYEQNGKSAATIIHAAAVKHGINPLVLLTRLQMEQGLVNKTTASAATIEIAFGCGCPHSPVCSDRYMGFENQTECAAGTLSRSMVAATTSTGTVSGWARNRSKQTQDGISITPKNAATAALYTYTPWVGEAGGGRAGVGGASLHHAVWVNLASAANYGAWANGDTAPAPSTPTNGTNEESENTAEQPDAAVAPEPPEGEEEPAPTPSPDAGSTADAGPAPSPDGGSQLGESSAPPSDGSEDEGLLTEGSAPPSSNTPPPKPNGRRSPEELPEASEEELAAKPKKASEGGCSMTSTGAATGDGLLFGLGLIAAIVRTRKRSKAHVSA